MGSPRDSEGDTDQDAAASVGRRAVRLATPDSGDQGPWRGAVEWQVTPPWATAWRLPAGASLRPALRGQAESATGVRAELVTDARSLSLPVRVAGAPLSVIDVVVAGELAHRTTLTDGVNVVTTRLPGTPVPVEIWLPHDGRVGVGAMDLSEASVVSFGHAARPRWFAYGSSITHCQASPGPSETWPAVVAREHGWDLTCLGFNGQALLDLPVARTIADAAPDLITLCVGINIFNASLMSRAELSARLEEFLAIAGAGARRGRIAVMSPIASPSREEVANDAGMTLVDLRRVVAQVVGGLGSQVSYVHGPDVFGPGDADLLSDGLHPDAAGYRLMGRRLTSMLGEWAGSRPVPSG